MLGAATGDAWWVLPGYVIAVAVVTLACVVFLSQTRTVVLVDPASASGSARDEADTDRICITQVLYLSRVTAVGAKEWRCT